MSGFLGQLGGNASASIVAPLENNGLASITGLLGIGFRPNLGMLQSLPDVAPDWMWTADIVNVPSLIGLSNLYVVDLQFGYNTMDSENIYRNGIYQTFPRHTTANHVTLGFYEPFTYNVSQFLYNWKSLVRNPQSGYYGVPAGYMGTIIVTLYDPSGIPQMTVNLLGVWPLQIHGFNFQFAQSGPVRTMCDFAINDAVITYSASNLIGGFVNGLIGGAISGIEGALSGAASGTFGDGTSQGEQDSSATGGNDDVGQYGD